MKFTAEIPTKPYIKKIIENTFGAPARVNRNNYVGKIIYEMLDHQRRKTDWRYSNAKFKTIVILQLTEDVHLRYGCFFTRENIIKFNATLEEIIKEGRNLFIEGLLTGNSTMTITEAIERYQEKFNLSEDDFPFESIKKDYYRHRQALKTNVLKLSREKSDATY